MSEETSTTTTTTPATPPMPPPTTEPTADKPAGWKDVADASAANVPDDPPPRFFVRELDCDLTDKQRVDIALKCLDLQAQIEDFDAETKAIMADRKSAKAKIAAEAKELQDQTRTGRVKRKVRCAEHTSYQQHRKFIVRMDKKKPDGSYVEIDETPLSPAERQRTLPGVTVDAPKKADAEKVEGEAANDPIVGEPDEHEDEQGEDDDIPEGDEDEASDEEEDEDGDAPFDTDDEDEDDAGDEEEEADDAVDPETVITIDPENPAASAAPEKPKPAPKKVTRKKTAAASKKKD